MPRPERALVRFELRQATRSLKRDLLGPLPSERELEQLPLHPILEAGPSAGSRPQTVMEDERGRRYLFKLAPPELIAAELLAHRLRELGRRLQVPTARRTLELPELGRVTGMLQPEIPVVGPLPGDPLVWSPMQVEVMLREHPWEWLLANLDTHVDQYVLVGADQLPLNIDWDHSLVDLAQTSLTRFNRRSTTIAPVRNLLYAEYVRGRIDLDFYSMRIQARKAADLPDEAVVELLDRHAQELGLPDAQRLENRERMLARKASLVTDFDALVESLRHERDDNLGVSAEPRSGLVRAVAFGQDAWQRFAIVVLHTRVVRPALRGYRAVLRSVARVRAS